MSITLTNRDNDIGGLLVLLIYNLFSTTLLNGAFVRLAKNLYNYVYTCREYKHNSNTQDTINVAIR